MFLASKYLNDQERKKKMIKKIKYRRYTSLELLRKISLLLYPVIQ